MMHRWALAFAVSTAVLFGQPRIVVDPQRPEHDTLDFGVTLVSKPIARPLYIINAGPDTLLLPEPVRPYFSIERTPEQGSDTYDYLEFEPLTRFPIIVLPRQTQQLWLSFASFAEFYPLGLKQAALRISLRRAHDTRVVLTRSFVLTGVKVELRLEV
ncbi:MAG: hypothetical protein RMJ46_04535, partial [Bacteroidota bacterium]|nr:hypothetical protein [Bacteroidota bacterium]